MHKLLSLFIAGCMSFGLYHELRLSAFPRLEDSNNFAMYMFLVDDMYVDERSPENWHARSVGCSISALWFKLWDDPLQAGSIAPVGADGTRSFSWNPARQYKNCDMFASYHAAFYLLTCIVLILFLDKPLVAMAGTAASILFCSPAFFCPYLMPWDLPTMFLWTLIFLVYRWFRARPGLREEWMWLAVLIVFGGLFKETVLVTALFLLGAPWSWPRRLVTIAVVVIVSQVINWRITGAAPDWLFSVGEGAKSGGDRWNPLLLWPALLANAGSLLVLPWAFRERKDWPLAVAVISFVALQALNNLACGIYDENRNWLEIAPLSWVLVGELFMQSPTIAAQAIHQRPAAPLQKQKAKGGKRNA